MRKILSLYLLLICAYTAAYGQNPQAYMNAPKKVCASLASDNKRWATMNAFVYNANNNSTIYAVQQISWSITSPPAALPYNVLYGVVNTASTNKDDQTLTLEFTTPGSYTLRAEMRSNASGATKTYSVEKTIVVEACPMQDCKGQANNKAGFTENFGIATAPAEYVDPGGQVGYNFRNTTTDLQDDQYALYNWTNLRPEWVKRRDKTGNPNGAMLVANSSYNAKTFYSRRVDKLCPGAVYNFSAWFMNVNTKQVLESTCALGTVGNGDNTLVGYRYAGVTFGIYDAFAGTLLKSFNTNDVSMWVPTTGPYPNAGTAWQQYGGTFKTPPDVTSVIVKIVNNNPGGCGNDIAIDDITFSYCSPFIYGYFDGQTNQLGGQYTMCAGAATTLTSGYSPTDYFNKPIYFWEYSINGTTWLPIAEENGVHGAATSILTFDQDAKLLEGDPVDITNIYFRLNIYEKGNNANCAAPSIPIEVTLLPNPRITVTEPGICQGTKAVLEASGGYDTYTWGPPVNTTGPIVEDYPVKTTIYTVTGEKKYGNLRTCRREGQATVTVYDKPVVALTLNGADKICESTQVDLKIAGGLSKYTIVWSPVNTGPDPTHLVHTPAAGVTNYTVTVTNGKCVVTDSKPVVVTAMPVANAGNDQQQCNNGDFTLQGALGADETGEWTIEGTVAGVTITDKNDPVTTVKGLGYGQSLTLVWTVRKNANTACISTGKVVLSNVAEPAASEAGPHQTQCDIDVFTMAANAPQAGETGTWKVITSTAVIADIHKENTTVTITGIQDVVLTWTISNGTCAGTPGTIVLGKKNPPAIVLTPVLNTCNTAGELLLYYTSVSGSPSRYDVLAAGPGPMPGFTDILNKPFGAAPIRIPCPAGTPAGKYTFKLVIRNDYPGCTKEVPFTAEIEAPAVPPDAVVADKPDICISGKVTLSVQGGTLGTGAEWVWYADACGGTPVDKGSSIEVTVNKTTTFYVRAETKGVCGNTACWPVTVTVYPMPGNVHAGPDQEHCADPDFIMDANTPDVPGATGTWSITSASVPLSSIVIADIHSASTLVTIPDGATVTLQWSITNGTCTSAPDDVTLENVRAISGNSISADQTVCLQETPAALNGSALLGGAGVYTYQWQLSTTAAGSGFSDISGANSAGYTPGMLTQDTWFRRIVSSGPCMDNSSNVVKITVVDQTSPVITPAPADIVIYCGDRIPAPAALTATDNCDAGFPKKIIPVEDPYVADACAGYTIIRRWRVADACGNQAEERVQRIKVEACPRPQLNPALPVNCPDNSRFTITLLNKVDNPVFILTAVTPANAVRTPLMQTSNVFELNGATEARFVAKNGITGCVSDTVIYKLQYNAKPVVNLGRDTTICKGETLRLRANGSGITYVRWSDGSTGPYLDVTEPGAYSVTVFNDCGSSSSQVTVGFTQCGPKPTFPNAFTPNGDGKNDFFKPVVRGPMYEYELHIFNRWGELIYLGRDNKLGWDGRHKGIPVGVGAYVWWLTYKKTPGGAANVLKGEVTVLR